MSEIENINLPEDLKKLDIKEKEKLSAEIRKEILNVVSNNGGHLASNLGVVELTIALHSVFNAPKDKIVWDVGHQTYVHKILTGRKDKMNSLRKRNGIAGFPKREESEYDTFNTGHSSTSISAAIGMARARDIKKENYLPQLKKILNDSKTYSLNATLRNERKAHINAYSLKNRYVSIIITYLDENDEL